jgi:hypothetical protein
MTATTTYPIRQLRRQGERSAEQLAALLPVYQVKRLSSDLEWGVWMDSQYCGGFCWDDAWFRLDVPAENFGRLSYIPCPPLQREEVRRAINQVLEEVSR